MNEAMGQVITFYSYKGGTGRSMALANVACLLAQQEHKGKGVLMIDWDLEAPGLHHFFRSRFTKRFPNTSTTESILDKQLGLIDLFIELNSVVPAVNAKEKLTEENAETLL